MKKYKSIQRGFTLIELLMVVALIAILSTIILMSLDSGRERAEVNKYLAYGTQMHKVVADAAAAGKFDKGSLSVPLRTGTHDYCLGTYTTNCGTRGTAISATSTGDDKIIYDALTYLGSLPELKDGNGFSPYDSDEGIHMTLDSSSNRVRVNLYLIDASTHDVYADKICSSIGWSRSGDYCYIDVQLHSRL